MIAHFDCFAGAAGDMILAALIDAGADVEFIGKQIAKLGPTGIETTTVHKRGVRATHVSILPAILDAQSPAEADELIARAGLDAEIETRSRATLRRLAEAEARVHGISVDEVHFHELSAADTLADIVGAFAAMSNLGIESATASPIATGMGVINTDHGVLPNPGPAVIELLKGAPLRQLDLNAELITPTGAAILSECVSRFGPMPAMTVRASGYGAGTQDLEMPNVLRVIIGDSAEPTSHSIEELHVEANVDDMNPEFYTYVCERLFEAGAHDVWIVPVIGKHGRPANVLNVLVSPDGEAAIREIIVTETSTLGVRYSSVSKWMLEREWVEVTVEGHPIRVKIARHGGRVVNVAPEYADCAEAARRTGSSLKQVFRQALSRVDVT